MANDLFSMKGSNLFNPFLPTPASTTLFNSKPADLFPPSSKPNIFSKQEPLPKRSSDDDTQLKNPLLFAPSPHLDVASHEKSNPASLFEPQANQTVNQIFKNSALSFFERPQTSQEEFTFPPPCKPSPGLSCVPNHEQSQSFDEDSTPNIIVAKLNGNQPKQVSDFEKSIQTTQSATFDVKPQLQSLMSKCNFKPEAAQLDSERQLEQFHKELVIVKASDVSRWCKRPIKSSFDESLKKIQRKLEDWTQFLQYVPFQSIFDSWLEERLRTKMDMQRSLNRAQVRVTRIKLFPDYELEEQDTFLLHAEQRVEAPKKNLVQHLPTIQEVDEQKPKKAVSHVPHSNMIKLQDIEFNKEAVMQLQFREMQQQQRMLDNMLLQQLNLNLIMGKLKDPHNPLNSLASMHSTLGHNQQYPYQPYSSLGSAFNAQHVLLNSQLNLFTGQPNGLPGQQNIFVGPQNAVAHQQTLVSGYQNLLSAPQNSFSNNAIPMYGAQNIFSNAAPANIFQNSGQAPSNIFQQNGQNQNQPYPTQTNLYSNTSAPMSNQVPNIFINGISQANNGQSATPGRQNIFAANGQLTNQLSSSQYIQGAGGNIFQNQTNSSMGNPYGRTNDLFKSSQQTNIFSNQPGQSGYNYGNQNSQNIFAQNTSNGGSIMSNFGQQQQRNQPSRYNTRSNGRG